MNKAIVLMLSLLACASIALATPPGPNPVPEIDPGSVSQGVALLLGSGLLYRFRRSR